MSNFVLYLRGEVICAGNIVSLFYNHITFHQIQIDNGLISYTSCWVQFILYSIPFTAHQNHCNTEWRGYQDPDGRHASRFARKH